MASHCARTVVARLCRYALAAALASTSAAHAAEPAAAPSQVRIVATEGSYQLLVNGVPFRVKGAGLEHGSQEALAAHGGNAFRTWRTDNGRESGGAVLDRARRNGLFVALGIEVAGERHGFDYDDPRAVARQLARVRAEVLRHKDHPALLMWVVGNELNLESRNPRVWDAVGRIADMIHEVDPHHPVMTTLAGFDPALIELVRTRAASLDLLGLQLYGDLAALPRKLRESGWTGPYIVTEWGPTGHWESPLTTWGAPLEDDSTRKADLLQQRYLGTIEADQRQCLGSFVFLWGQKQERTPTWYGLFLASGEATAGVDTMQYLWTGSWPADRSPSIAPIQLDGRRAGESIVLAAGREYRAEVQADDDASGKLDYRWSVSRESRASSIGGDPETVPARVPVPMAAGGGVVRFTAPTQAGTYRLFVTVHDGSGRAAYANAPFRVEEASRGR